MSQPGMRNRSSPRWVHRQQDSRTHTKETSLLFIDLFWRAIPSSAQKSLLTLLSYNSWCAQGLLLTLLSGIILQSALGPDEVLGN